MKLETLLEIKAENERFVKRLEDAIRVAQDPIRNWRGECYNNVEAGALKRSALDIKLVLTKITSPKS